MNSFPNPNKIGIIGGGQLGKMLAIAGAPWDIQFRFLDAPHSPCADFAYPFVEGSINNPQDIQKLAQISDILSYEIEHVHTPTLIELENEGKTIIPKPSVLQIINDKGKQKTFLQNLNLPVPEFYILRAEEDWNLVLNHFKGNKVVAKTLQGGYDGKGVEIITKEQIIEGYRPFPTNNTMLEQCIDATEISVIVAIDQQGNIRSYPPVVMEFDPVSNLVTYLHTAHNLSKETEQDCIHIAQQAANALQSPGLFAVELFLDSNNHIFINEIAPRPHNSGHHTIEACVTSQYEQLNRILLDLPLGSTALLKHAAMINLVGPNTFSGSYSIAHIQSLMDIPEVYVHLYGKKVSKPNRKLGHITILANHKSELFQKVNIVKKLIAIVQ